MNGEFAENRLPARIKTSDPVVNSSEISPLFSAAASPKPVVQNVADSHRSVLRRLPGCKRTKRLRLPDPIITRSVAAFCRAAQICRSNSADQQRSSTAIGASCSRTLKFLFGTEQCSTECFSCRNAAQAENLATEMKGLILTGVYYQVGSFYPTEEALF